jgi:hypothetical protein
MKRPAFQFYPSDWRSDTALQSCSLPARGLWIECMCLMHESENYGYLQVGGKPMNSKQLARIVGESQESVEALTAELEDAGVFSRDDKGCIYSRRMVRDEHIRNVRANSGRLGGNPNLLNQKTNQNESKKENQENLLKQKSSKSQPNAESADNLASKRSPTPSSSSSTSTSNTVCVCNAREEFSEESFSMEHGWKPNIPEFEAKCVQQKVKKPSEAEIAPVIEALKGFYLPRDGVQKTQSGWEYELINFLKTARLKPYKTKNKATVPKAEKFDSRDYGSGIQQL